MKNTVLMFLTTVILAGASFAAAGNGDVGSVGDGREAAKFLHTVEMDEYFIRADNVKSVDILVDYEMIEIDCHGVPTLYQAAQTPGDNSIFIQKQYLPRTANMCIARPGPAKMAQSGLKLNVKPGKFSKDVFQSILVPAGSKVEFIKNK